MRFPVKVVDSIAICSMSTKIAILFADKEFVKLLFRFGGCRSAWISLKSLTLFSTSLFTVVFTKSIIFGLFGLKVLMKDTLLLFSIVLG